MRPFSRLFALAPDCHAAGNRYGRLWQRHFYDGLAGALRDVVFPTDVDFTWARPASGAVNGPSPQRAAVSQKLREQIRSSGAGAVLSYAFASDIEPGLVRDTVALGIPWINFFCDSTYAFDRVEALAREASLNWFPETAAEARYAALGRRWLCRPYALNPGALPEATCETAVHQLGFVGAPTGNRVRRLAALAALGCRVAVHGEGWQRPSGFPGGARTASRASFLDPRRLAQLPRRIAARALRLFVHAGGRLDDEGLTRFVSECRVMLGLNEGGAVPPAGRSYLKLRDVEFPGYGACYLTQHNADIERAFDVGREVLTFRGLAEAVAAARDHAAHPALAQAVGRAGRRRVLAEHTGRAASARSRGRSECASPSSRRTCRRRHFRCAAFAIASSSACSPRPDTRSGPSFRSPGRLGAGSRARSVTARCRSRTPGICRFHAACAAGRRRWRAGARATPVRGSGGVRVGGRGDRARPLGLVARRAARSDRSGPVGGHPARPRAL